MPDDFVDLAGASGGVVRQDLTYFPPVICAALWSIMSKCGYVQKQGKNKFQDYKYAGEGHLLDVLRPAMVEEGLLLIPSGKTRSPIDEHGITHVEVEYTLAHKSGAVWPEKIVAYGDGGDKNSKGVGDKGLYKALTGANKYLLFKLFQIETGDDPEKEAEHDKPEPAHEPEPQKSPPGISKVKTDVREAIREMNACSDVDTFMSFLETGDIKRLGLKVCRDYPQEWIGPEEYSGMRGAIERVAESLECGPGAGAWIRKAEEAARQPVKS